MNRPSSANSFYTTNPSPSTKVLPIRSASSNSRPAPASGVGNYIGTRLRQSTRSRSGLNRENIFDPGRPHSRSASVTDLDSEDDSSIGGLNGATVKHEYTDNTQTSPDEDESFDDDEPPSTSRAATPRPLSVQRNIDNAIRTGSPSPKVRSPRSSKFPQQFPDLRQFLPGNGTDIFADNDSTPSLSDTTLSLNSKKALLDRMKLPVPSFGQNTQQDSPVPWGKPELVREKSEDSEIMEIRPDGFAKGGVPLGDTLGGNSGMNSFGAGNNNWADGGGGGGKGNLKTENEESYYEEQGNGQDSYGEEFDDQQQGDETGYESDGYEEEAFDPTTAGPYDSRDGSIAYGSITELMSPEPENGGGMEYINLDMQQQGAGKHKNGNDNGKSELWSIESPTISSHDWPPGASESQDNHEKNPNNKGKQKATEPDTRPLSFSPPRRRRSPPPYPAYAGLTFGPHNTNPNLPNPDLWRSAKAQENTRVVTKNSVPPPSPPPEPVLRDPRTFTTALTANGKSPGVTEDYSPPPAAIQRYSSRNHVMENPSSVDSFRPLLPDSHLSTIRTYSDLRRALTTLTSPRHAITRAELPSEIDTLATYSYPSDSQKAREFFAKLDEDMWAAAGEYICSKKREVEDAIRGCREKRRKIVEKMEREVVGVAERRVGRLKKLEERREMLRGGIGKVLREGGLWL